MPDEENKVDPLAQVAANDEVKKLDAAATVPEPPAPAKAPEVPPAAPAPKFPLGRNGRPIISRTYLSLLLVVALALPLSACAGTAAGNALDQAAGVRITVNPDGSKTYEKLPTSPIQDVGGMFGPLGTLIAGVVVSGIYAVRKLGDSVPKDSHDKALANKAPGSGEGA